MRTGPAHSRRAGLPWLLRMARIFSLPTPQLCRALSHILLIRHFWAWTQGHGFICQWHRHMFTMYTHSHTELSQPHAQTQCCPLSRDKELICLLLRHALLNFSSAHSILNSLDDGLPQRSRASALTSTMGSNSSCCGTAMRLPSYFSEPRFLINKMGITAPLVLNEERRVALTAGLLHLISHSALTGGLGLRPPLFGDLCAFAPPAHPPPPHLQHPALAHTSSLLLWEARMDLLGSSVLSSKDIRGGGALPWHLCLCLIRAPVSELALRDCGD